MDPITLAAQRFMAEVETFAGPPPGLPIPSGPRILRLLVAADDQHQALKALRWLEHLPRNRRPMCIVEAPFENEAQFSAAISAQLHEDLELLRVGLAESGFDLTVPVRSAPPSSATETARQLGASAECVGRLLDGLYVVLAPSRIDDVAGYVRLVIALSPRLEATRLHLLVLDAPNGMLATMIHWEACFVVDQEQLLDYLEGLAAKPSAGPAVESRPRPTPAQKKQVEAALGIRLASQDASRSLRSLLLRAGRSLARGEARSAVRRLRAARTLCQLDRLVAEEAMVLMALGAALLQWKNEQGALAAYRDAKVLALELRNKTLAAQAELGAAFVRGSLGQVEEARIGYREAASLAGAGSPIAIQVERMG